MNNWLIAAAALAALTTLVHFFVGGRQVAKPLLETGELNSLVKFTHYFCWHIVTIALAAMALGLAYAGLNPGGRDVAILMVVLAATIAVWNFAMNARHRLKASRHPQFVFFIAIVALASPGLLPA